MYIIIINREMLLDAWFSVVRELWSKMRMFLELINQLVERAENQGTNQRWSTTQVSDYCVCHYISDVRWNILNILPNKVW